ncbi:unnamed protein product [Phaeothamnion confervicola]
MLLLLESVCKWAARIGIGLGCVIVGTLCHHHLGLASAAVPVLSVAGLDDPSMLCHPPGEAGFRIPCTLGTASSGDWIPTTITPVPPRDEGAHTIGASNFPFICDQRWADHHNISVTGLRPLWHWCPESCRLPAFRKLDFCDAVRSRDITGFLVVGDSLNRLFMTTLAMALRSERLPDQSDKISAGGEAYLACGGALRLKFVRNDILRVQNMSDDNSCATEGKINICQSFMPYLDAGQGYNAVVVNSGAHYIDDDAYVVSMTVAADAISARMREAHADSSLMLFRNTVPGSPDCDNFEGSPPLELGEAESIVASASNKEPEEEYKPGVFKYNWADLKRHNALAEPIFAARGFVLLDVYTPTVRRFDSHIGGADCLHYCIPGPIDHWIRLLQLALTTS